MACRLTKISFIVLLFFLSGVSQGGVNFSATELRLKGLEYHLQIADTEERRQLGLMYRPSLAPQVGMLFVYHKTGNNRIWMKNTLIPLTVIWLDEQAQIIDIKLLQPCETENCRVYSASRPSRYILELHQSQLSRFEIGDYLPAITELAPD